MQLFPIASVCLREGLPWPGFQSITDHADRDSEASWQAHGQAGRHAAFKERLATLAGEA